MYEKMVKELLEGVGIEVNGNRPWDIRIKKTRNFTKELYKIRA